MLFNEDYERAILGGLLTDNDQIEIAGRYINADDFYTPRYKVLYHRIVKLLGENSAANIITVLADGDSPSEIASLTNVPVGGIEFYCKKVRDLSVRRKIVISSRDLMESAKDVSKSVYEILEEMSTITQTAENKSWGYQRAGEVLAETIKEIENLYYNGGMLGISSGYKNIDRYTGGFIPSELTIIGARASIGKTAIALNMAENISHKVPVGFMSLEMKNSLLVQRLISGISGVGTQGIRTGRITENDFMRITDAAEKINEYPLYLYDFPNARLLDLKNKARLLKRKEGIKILFVDYIGLIRTEKNVARWEEVGYISSELKALARELEIPVVACCQVNRDAEGKPPNLSNLRESGSIEQDADVVIFLHRNRDKSETSLIVAKNRNGGTGKIDLHFDLERTKFTEVERP